MRWQPGSGGGGGIAPDGLTAAEMASGHGATSLISKQVMGGRTACGFNGARLFLPLHQMHFFSALGRAWDEGAHTRTRMLLEAGIFISSPSRTLFSPPGTS